MAHGMVKLDSRRHSRGAGPVFLRRLTLALLVVLVVVYGLGIGGSGTALAMAVLTGLALLCYVGALARDRSARDGSAERRAMDTLPPSPARAEDPAAPPRPRAVWPAGGPFSKLVVPARNGRPLPTPAQTPTSWFTPE
jgi:hypothetical protein